MQGYHASNSLSSGGYPDIPVRNTSNVRKLGPFEYIATPPIQHLLNAILSYCRVGGSFAPGVRQLGEMSGVTLGLISGLLYELDRTGWISYDGHVIMVLRHPDSDQGSGDQLISDQLIATSLIDDDESDYSASGSDDQNPDRSDRHMVDSCLAAADSESNAAARSKIPCAEKNDQRPDHRIALLSELGTAPKLIAKALAKRPNLTPGQIRATWSHFESRIKAGSCTAGAFHAAIANGQIHAAPPDPTAPLDPASYAGRADIMLGSDLPPPDAPESIGDIARRLLPPDASTADWVFVQSRLVRHDSESGALAALEARKRVA